MRVSVGFFVLSLSAVALSLGACDCAGGSLDEDGGLGGGAGGGLGGGAGGGNGDGGPCQEVCLAEDCGEVADGCGGTLVCPLSCPFGQTCGAHLPNQCGVPSCTPMTPEEACAGKCGQVSNGCFGAYECDGSNGGLDCTEPEFCGALAANACGNPSTCTAMTCAELGHSCGLASNGCGQVLDCWPEGASACPNPASQGCVASATTGAQSCVTGSTGCVGPLCSAVSACAAESPTALTGTVLTPGRNGNNTLPVPNAIVYIPGDPSVALPTISEGVDTNDAAGSCGRCEDERLVADGQTILAAAVTDYRGQFTLEGRIPVGVPFQLVVKVGKWRRVIEVPGNIAQPCAPAALGNTYTRLAASTADGLAGTHLPRIAISTGQVDEMECVLLNMGIDVSEFTLSSGAGRVHMYRANGAMMAGACLGGSSCTNNNNEGCRTGASGCSWAANYRSRTLYRNADRLSSYDLVVFDCEGQANSDYPNYHSLMRNYVDGGGRLFASHWAYNWIRNNGSLHSSAPWNTTGDADTDRGYLSLTSGPTQRAGANPVKSALLRDWLNYQSAITLHATSGAYFSIADARDLAGASVGPATDEWVYRTTNTTESPTGTVRVQQLSFNTPYAADEEDICGRVAYSGFHVAGADTNHRRFFPGVCSTGTLSTQEKVLAFMLFDLASCVSAGDPPTPPVCTPKTVADLCPGVNDACGVLADGCGGVVDCNGCGEGYYCNGTQCTPVSCVPADCDDRMAECGFNVDGCGATLDCGACPMGQVCGGGGVPNVCDVGSCTPRTQLAACTGASTMCGQASDGCGGLVECGSCGLSFVCIQGVCFPINPI